ncbi:hypothetical protein IC582_006219 [Cucumis melo]
MLITLLFSFLPNYFNDFISLHNFCFDFRTTLVNVLLKGKDDLKEICEVEVHSIENYEAKISTGRDRTCFDVKGRNGFKEKFQNGKAMRGGIL